MHDAMLVINLGGWCTRPEHRPQRIVRSRNVVNSKTSPLKIYDEINGLGTKRLLMYLIWKYVAGTFCFIVTWRDGN
jgi:hypothetical protein